MVRFFGKTEISQSTRIKLNIPLPFPLSESGFIMTISAYILLNIDIGRVKDVMDSLAKIEECRSVSVVSGVYDILVRVDVDTMEDLHDLTTERVHSIPGITKTITQVIEKEIRT